MPDIVVTIVEYGAIFVALVSVIAFVHELGHYAVARLCGVHVEAFAIGFGREFIGWTSPSGTRFKLCMLPLGGYVKLYCHKMPDAAVTPAELRRSYQHRPLLQRGAIILAGPAANLLFALVALVLLLLVLGRLVEGPEGRVRAYPGPVQAVTEGAQIVAAIAGDTLDVTLDIVTGGRRPQELAGPIQIAKLAGDTMAALGFGALLLLTSLLSINVGLINLLPLPVLDGGQLVLLLVERVRGRPLGRRAHAICSLGGLAAVLVIFLLITYSDLIQLGIL